MSQILRASVDATNEDPQDRTECWEEHIPDTHVQFDAINCVWKGSCAANEDDDGDNWYTHLKRITIFSHLPMP